MIAGMILVKVIVDFLEGKSDSKDIPVSWNMCFSIPSI